MVGETRLSEQNTSILYWSSPEDLIKHRILEVSRCLQEPVRREWVETRTTGSQRKVSLILKGALDLAS